MWKAVCASSIGTAHAKRGLPCQDHCLCLTLKDKKDSTVLVAIVSDGAGSALKAEFGASFICTSFANKVRAFFDEGGMLQLLTRDQVTGWLTDFQTEVCQQAAADGLTKRDFACTFLAALVGENSALFIQIGDGAMIVSSPEETDEYAWIFWPQQGEYVNETYFATDESATERLEYEMVEHRVDEVALFTDGIQNLVLHNQSQAVHSPFFSQWFTWLRQIPESMLEKATNALADYLDSPKINERTDDDKSLLLATRNSFHS